MNMTNAVLSTLSLATNTYAAATIWAAPSPLIKLAHRLASIGSRHHPIILSCERATEGLAHLRIIIDHQHIFFRRRHLIMSSDYPRGTRYDQAEQMPINRMVKHRNSNALLGLWMRDSYRQILKK